MVVWSSPQIHRAHLPKYSPFVYTSTLSISLFHDSTQCPSLCVSTSPFVIQLVRTYALILLRSSQIWVVYSSSREWLNDILWADAMHGCINLITLYHRTTFLPVIRKVQITIHTCISNQPLYMISFFIANFTRTLRVWAFNASLILLEESFISIDLCALITA